MWGIPGAGRNARECLSRRPVQVLAPRGWTCIAAVVAGPVPRSRLSHLGSAHGNLAGKGGEFFLGRAAV